MYMQRKHVAEIILESTLYRTDFDCKENSRALAFIHKFGL